MAETKITFDAADDYERYMGRWSRAVGERFLDWLGAPRDARWLDVGCGTGALSDLILARAAPKTLTGIDPSPAQIDYVRKLLPGTFEVGDSMAMPFADGAFDVVASALVIHFIPDRAKAFAEMKRVLAPGGLVGGYTWKRTATADYAAYAPVLRGAEHIGGVAMRSPVVPEGTVEGMTASLNAAGFTDASAIEIEVTRTFASFDEFWTIHAAPFSPSGKTIAQFDDAGRARLRADLAATLPAADGTVTHAATAIAGKGRKP
jgi:SAM-dependent methyltransferase